MPQLEPLKCPSCTASLEYNGRSETIRCGYCGTTIIVPDSMKTSSAISGVLGDEDPVQAANIHEILRLVQAGKKIEAIKLYRETFGVSLVEAKDAVENLERGDPTAIGGKAIVTTVGATTAATTGCGCLLPFIIVVIMMVAGLFIYRQESPEQFDTILQGFSEGDMTQVLEGVDTNVVSIVNNRAVYNEPILLTPSGDGIPPDLLLETWAYGGVDIPVSLAQTSVVDGSRQIAWEADLGIVGEHNYHVGFDDQQVYISQGSALRAVDRDTGEVVWETVLSDEVRNNCDVCIRAAKDHVVVLTTDNALEAFDTRTGRSAWQVRLENEYFSYPGAGQLAFALVDGMVAIMDGVEVDGVQETAVFFYDLETGAEVRHILPLCSDLNNFFDDDSLGHNGQLYLNETSGEMVALFGVPAYVQQMCLQKWDTTTGELLLEARASENLDHSSTMTGGMMGETSRYPFASISPEALLTTLQIEQENGRSTGIVKFDLATGETDFQFADEDYNLAVIGQVDDVIVAWAERQRGTTQSEIWGLDETTGEKLWTHFLDAEYLYELDPFNDRFAYHLQPDGLVVLQLLTDSEPSQLRVEKLNLADGSLIYETTTPLTEDDWRGLAWTNDHAYLTLTNLLAVDLATGETAVEWP
ncbi:MAG: PQQ-binding-like beta-propeller repeat protein [Anaerolineae bacterium]|nr:PQQ-binding-like beta-propeller repeat protein [Anaerolineae bacterium]